MDEHVNDHDLIQGVLESVNDVYKLRDGQLRVLFHINGVDYVLPLDDDVDAPIFKAIQAILRQRRTWLMLKYGKFVDMRDNSESDG